MIRPSTVGTTDETGLKADLLNGHAYGSVSIFHSEQENVAEFVDSFVGTLMPGWQDEVASRAVPCSS